MAVDYASPWGAALNSLSKSLPDVGQSVDNYTIEKNKLALSELTQRRAELAAADQHLESQQNAVAKDLSNKNLNDEWQRKQDAEKNWSEFKTNQTKNQEKKEAEQQVYNELQASNLKPEILPLSKQLSGIKFNNSTNTTAEPPISNELAKVLADHGVSVPDSISPNSYTPPEVQENQWEPQQTVDDIRDTSQFLPKPSPPVSLRGNINAIQDDNTSLAALKNNLTTPRYSYQLRDMLNAGVPAMGAYSKSAKAAYEAIQEAQNNQDLYDWRNNGIEERNKNHTEASVIAQQNADTKSRLADITKEKLDSENLRFKGSYSKGGTLFTPSTDNDFVAQQLAFGKLDPDSFAKMYSKFKGGDATIRAVYQLATKYNPEFNFAEAKADFASFKNNAQRMQMNNIERANRLLDTYQALSDAVKRGDVTGVNHAVNWLGINTSDLSTTKLDAMQTVMQEDLSRALTQTGATSDKKLDKAGDISNIMSLSNEAAIAKIDIVREVLAQNKKSIESNWGIYGQPNALDNKASKIIEWAKTHRDDPRAITILQHHGIK